MKILLDESLPRKLKNYFGMSHEVFTVHDMEWLSKKNGELLKLMYENHFDIFVTVDRNLTYQQKINNRQAIIFVLCAKDNRLETLKLLIPTLLNHLANGKANGVVEIC